MNFKRIDTTGILYWNFYIGEPKLKPCIELSEERKRFVLKLMTMETPDAGSVDIAKNAVRERDIVCVDCGLNHSLECHHLIPVDVDPFKKADVDNMVLVCYWCHKNRHYKMRYAQK